MGQMGLVRRKLRETLFFFLHLCDEKTALKPEAEDLAFFLSAFLSAGRSVIEFFERQDRYYGGWFHGWKMSLVNGDRKLLNDIAHQRNLEVHEGSAHIIPQFEPVSATGFETGPRDKELWSDPCNPVPPTAKKKYYFWIDGKQLGINSTCRRYLELLLKLVNDFEEGLGAP